MSSHRFLFHAPQLEPDDPAVTLGGDDHYHLGRVLRLSPGDETFVTNGRGLIVRVRLARATREQTEAEVVETVVDRPRGPRLTLALALIKKDRFAQALEQCVELGMTDCVPFVSAGCRLRELGAAQRRRLERVCVAAMKQSFRAHLPRVEEAVSFDELCRRVEGYDRAYLGARGARAAPRPGGETVAVVGPEAGFGEGERAELERAGAMAASVSRHRLRSETAAVAMVAALAARD